MLTNMSCFDTIISTIIACMMFHFGKFIWTKETEENLQCRTYLGRRCSIERFRGRRNWFGGDSPERLVIRTTRTLLIFLMFLFFQTNRLTNLMSLLWPSIVWKFLWVVFWKTFTQPLPTTEGVPLAKWKTARSFCNPLVYQIFSNDSVRWTVALFFSLFEDGFDVLCCPS